MKKMILFLLCFVSIVQANFNTLDSLNRYINEYPELPKSDNDSWSDPDFTSFYPSLKPNLMQRIKKKLGFGKDYYWQPEAFKQLLTRVTEYRETSISKDLVTELELPTASKCVIWGDLHGALHSIVRELNELKRLGFLDNDLTIIKDDIYFVFLGDLVNRSSYSLEVLTIAVALMERNPEKVIYLKGNHEKNAYWENFSMSRALYVRAQEIAEDTDGVIPGKTLINRFFKTLPKALFIKHSENKKEAIYCAHSSIEAPVIQDSETQALIVGEKRLEVIRPTTGLEFLGFNHGTAQWSVLSSQIRIYRDYFKFYYDAFIILEMGKSVTTSTITLFNQDVRKKDGFKQTHFGLIFGTILQDKKDIEKVYSRKPFQFGSTVAVSGGLASLGGDVKRGIDSAAHDLNQKGGFEGKYFRPFIFDDEYVPRFARKNIDRLVQDYGIDIILSPVGSPTLSSYINRVKKGDDILVLFPYTGGPQFRDPEITNIVHFRSSYADEARALINHMIDEYGVKNFAFFYQNDSYGTGALEAAHEELKKRGISEWVDVPYAREQTDFEDSAAMLKKANPDAIGFFSTSTPTQELLGEIGSDFLIGRHLFGISFLESKDLKRFLKDRGIKFTFTFMVPNPEKSQLQIVQEYRKSMDKRGFPYESNSLEGYIAMELLIDAFKNITPSVTKEKVLEWFEEMKNYNFKGLNLTFNPKTRGFDQPVWIRIVNGELIKHEVS